MPKTSPWTQHISKWTSCPPWLPTHKSCHLSLWQILPCSCSGQKLGSDSWHLPTPRIQSLSKPCYFHLQNGSRFWPLLTSFPAATLVQTPSSLTWITSMVSKLVSLLLPSTPTVYSQQQPEVVIYQNGGLIMLLLCSKLSRCFHFSKGKNPKP